MPCEVRKRLIFNLFSRRLTCRWKPKNGKRKANSQNRALLVPLRRKTDICMQHGDKWCVLWLNSCQICLMCLLSACQDVVTRTSSKTFIMPVSVPTQLCQRRERRSYAHVHMHAHKPFKIFPFSYSSSPNHPSSATVVFIQSRVWRLPVMVSSNFPVIHFRATDGSSPGWLRLFLMASQFANSIPPRRFSKVLPYEAGERLFRGGEAGKSNRFYSVCCHSASGTGAKARMDWAQFASAGEGTLVCRAGNRGRLQGVDWLNHKDKIKRLHKLIFQGWWEELYSSFHVRRDFVK